MYSNTIYNIAINKNMFHPYHLQLSEVTMHVSIWLWIWFPRYTPWPPCHPPSLHSSRCCNWPGQGKMDSKVHVLHHLLNKHKTWTKSATCWLNVAFNDKGATFKAHVQTLFCMLCILACFACTPKTKDAEYILIYTVYTLQNDAIKKRWTKTSFSNPKQFSQAKIYLTLEWRRWGRNQGWHPGRVMDLSGLSPPWKPHCDSFTQDMWCIITWNHEHRNQQKTIYTIIKHGK